MTKRTDDELWGIAFRRLHDVAEALKAENVESMEAWALLFAVLQDLQAADLGMGSSAHERTLAMQREHLIEALSALRSRAEATPHRSSPIGTLAPLLLVDRSRNVVHRKDCAALLAVQSPTFEEFAGLEMALAGELTPCICCQALLLRYVSALLATGARRTSIGNVAQLSRSLEKLAEALDNITAESWATVASPPSSGTRSDH